MCSVLTKSLPFTKLHPVVIGVLFGTFISRMGFFMSLPFLGIYLHEVKEISSTVTGAIIGISLLVSTFTGFFGGTWSDRYGRLPVMIFSQFLWCLVFIGFTFAEHVWQFLLLNALNGFCKSIYDPAARALLVDLTTQEKRIEVFNARYFAINIGGAAGPLFGLLIGSSENTLSFLIGGIIFFLHGIVLLSWIFKYPETTNRSRNNENIPLKVCLSVIGKDKIFRYFLIGNIFITGAYTQPDTTLSQYLGSENLTLYTTLLITNSIGVLCMQYPLIFLMKKYSPLKIIKLGGLLFAIGLMMFGLSNSLYFLVIGMLIFTAGEILCFIIGDILISDIAPESMRGAYFGAAGLQLIGQSGGALVGGMLLDYLGFHNGLLIFGILAILTLFSYPFFQFGQILHTKREKNHLLPQLNSSNAETLSSHLE